MNLFASASYHLLPVSGRLRWRQERQQCAVSLIFAAVLVVSALPASACAKPGYKVHPGGIRLSVPVGERDGYLVSISASDHQHVLFTVDGPSSTIEYFTRGRVSSQRIEADFGALGQVDVRLDLARFESDPSRQGRCKGRGPLYRVGTYRGRIEFSDEGGVPDISIKRGRVLFKRSFRQVCRRRSPRSKPGHSPKLKRKIEEGVLTVRGKGEGRTVRLEATIFALRRNPAQSGGTRNATVYERHEGVRIIRRTGDFSDHDSFIMSRRGEKPETVEVELPEPFAGHALDSRSPGSAPSWTGDLTIDLPGAAGIPLTGPGFSAVLCRGEINSCLDGSSFYSQPLSVTLARGDVDNS